MRTFAILTLLVSLMGSATGQGTASQQSAVVSQIRLDLSAGRYEDAERLLKAALALEAGGFESIELRTALADLMREEGRDGESESMFTAILKDHELSWRQRVAALAGLAAVKGHEGHTAAGIAAWTESVILARSHKDRLIEATSLRGMAMTWLDAGLPAQSIPLLKRSLKLLEGSAATQPWDLSAAWAAEGEVYRALDKNTLAEDAFTKALALDQKVFGPNHPQSAFVMERLADIYSERHEFELARHHANVAVGVMRAACGEQSLALATAIAVQGDVEKRAGEYETAGRRYQAAINIVESHPGDGLLIRGLASRYAAMLKTLHRDREAKSLLRRMDSFRAK